MPVDPQVQVFLDTLAAIGAPPLHEQSVNEARQAIAALDRMGDTPEHIHSIENRSIPGPAGTIPIRIYSPEGQGPFPILVFFHGGGWVICDLDTHDPACRILANAAHCIIVSVDYRLAPEHKFPAAPEDCYAATQWVAQNATSINGDPARIAVGGDSAGGNLAAVVSLMARDRGEPSIAFQLLIYPVTDYYLPGTTSYANNAEGYFLTRDAMAWFWKHYISIADDLDNPYLNPLRAKDVSKLPPAYIVTAEFDPLCDEGEAYAQRLREAGVPVQARRYNGMIHGFFTMVGLIDQSKPALAEAASVLEAAWTREG
ncbi:MAG: alpha/beta hydrolase [Ktedonobacteraceae bacterium]|nr:alpha/beta hydrolase [Ktedonobacteraceae bacterium]